MLFLLTKYQDYHSGDNFQYYDWRTSAVSNQTSVRTNFTFDEFQTPIIVGGYHHEWSPGIHTLLLAGRLLNDQRFSDLAVPELIIFKGTVSNVTSVSELPFDVKYRSEFEAYTAELSQIFQVERQTLVFGGRVQGGRFHTGDELTAISVTNLFLSPAASTNSADDFRRTTAYAYYTLEPARSLFLTAGLTYDEVEFPKNHRNPPVFSGEERRDRIGPKAALV